MKVVRILYQNKDIFRADEKENKNWFGFMFNNNNKPNQMFKAIRDAIEKHKYKIFDLLLDEANWTSDSDLFKLSVNLNQMSLSVLTDPAKGKW